ELIDRLQNKAYCDAAVDYAQEIPVRVIAAMLGVSVQDNQRFRQWIHEFLEAGVTDSAVFMRAVEEVKAFFLAEIEKRRVNPGDDLINYLLSVRVDGQPLSEETLIGTLRVLLFGGIDTTWSAIGACLWHLATHSGDRKRLM